MPGWGFSLRTLSRHLDAGGAGFSSHDITKS